MSKTPALTFAFAAIVECQRAGGIAAFIDAAHVLGDLKAASLAGINIANLLVSQPDNANQATEIAETLARSGAIDLIVVAWNQHETQDAESMGPITEAALLTNTAIMLIPAR